MLTIYFKTNTQLTEEDLPSSKYRELVFKKGTYIYFGDLTELSNLIKENKIFEVESMVCEPTYSFNLNKVVKLSVNNYTNNTSDNMSWAIAEITSKNNRLINNTTNGVFCDVKAFGKDVDLICLDADKSVAISNHPEWLSPTTGENRFVEFNWSSLNGSFTQPSDYYSTRNTGGHGTSSLSVAGGRLYGMAKEATLYSIGVHPSSSGLWDSSEALNLVLLFHKNKSDKTRPTVLAYNSTIGSYLDTSLYNRVMYRGKEYTIDLSTQAGRLDAVTKYKLPRDIIPTGGSQIFISNTAGVTASGVESTLNELVKEGVTVIVPAGNSGQYLAYYNDEDWDNYLFNSSSSNVLYYNRHVAALSKGAIVIGATDVTMVDGKYQQATFSNRGKLVDMYAPGVGVPSATLTTSVTAGTVNYPLNNSFKAGMFGGTSSACPLTAGVAACIAGTIGEPKSVGGLVKGAAVIGRVHTDSLTTTNDRTLEGADSRFVHYPYGIRY